MKKKNQNPFIVNRLGDTGLRWVENVSKGWRLIGYADDLNRSIQHTGWFTDGDGMSETLRGIVYRLPSRKGSPVYAVGYADPWNDDCALLEIVTDCDDDSDAALRADSIAERCAETDREYQDAWQLGRKYASASETIASERETRKKLFQELKVVRAALELTYLPQTVDSNTSTLCETVRDRIKQTRRNIRAAYDRQRQIARDYYISGDLLEAFADGAELTIEQAKVIY